MNVLILLAESSSLPPPPAPDASEGIGMWQVLLVFALLTSALVVIVLAIKPLLLRPTLATDNGIGPPGGFSPRSYPPPPLEASIIPFPGPRPTPERSPTEPPAADPVISERLRRLTDDSIVRRRLGDRKQDRAGSAGENALASQADAQSAPVPESPGFTAESQQPGAIVVPPSPVPRITIAERIARAQLTENSPESTPAAEDPADSSEMTTEGITSQSLAGADVIDAAPLGVAASVHEGSDPTYAGAPPESTGETLGSLWETGPEEIGLIEAADMAEPFAAEDVAPVESLFGSETADPPSFLADTGGYLVEIVAPESDAAPASDDVVAEEEVAAIRETLRELMFCANVGEMLHGFSLYSDAYLFKTMDESGMTEAEFRAAYDSIPSRPPQAWVRLSGITDLTRLPDGGVSAVVTYADPRGGEAAAPERYRFVHDPNTSTWLIDGIDNL